jgi:AraC-like DNA-binding protein
MQILLIIGVFLAVFMAFLLFFKKQKQKADFTLLLILLLNATIILLASIEVYNRNNNYPYPFFINTSTALILLHGPLLWFYIKQLTSEKYRFKITYLLHFLPFAAILFLLYATMFHLPSEERIYIDQTESFKNELIFPIIILVIFISNQGYYIWGLFIRKKYISRIQSYFSKTDHLEMLWMKVLLISGLVFHSAISILYALDYMMNLMAYDFLQLTGFSFAALFVVFLGFFGIKQGNIFTDREIIVPQFPERVHMNTFENTSDEDAQIVKELLQYMNTYEPWKNPELTIAQLANQLQMSTDKLSEILNSKLNRNFFDFINRYRVDEFKRLCRIPENKKLTLIAMAYDSGFSSKATFNRVFKNITSTTPGEFYRNTIKNNDI